MKNRIVVLSAVLFGAVIASPAANAAAKPYKPPKPPTHSVSGVVTAVDAKKGSFSVKGRPDSGTFSICRSTIVQVSGRKVTLAAVKVGDKADVKIDDRDGACSVKYVIVTPGAPIGARS